MLSGSDRCRENPPEAGPSVPGPEESGEIPGRGCGDTEASERPPGQAPPQTAEGRQGGGEDDLGGVDPPALVEVRHGQEGLQTEAGGLSEDPGLVQRSSGPQRSEEAGDCSPAGPEELETQAEVQERGSPQLANLFSFSSALRSLYVLAAALTCLRDD